MPTKKAAPKKAAAKKTAVKKTAAKKAAVKKAVAKKAAVKKAAPKKAAIKKAAVKKAAPRKAVPRKAPARATEIIEAPPAPLPIWASVMPEADTPEARPPGAVTVSFEGPGPQRRVTVAFRIFLAIPQLLWIFVLSIAAFFAAIVGWFAALFTGKLPLGIHTFLTRVVQQSARVSAYSSMLITDRYPPFSLDAPDYVVSVETTPARLNRAAVLFRLILMIPTGIVVRVVGFGLSVASFVIWLIVLITGRLSPTLFEAEAAVLRFRVRYYAFAAMLTSQQPSGLFGDPADGDHTSALADLPTLPTRPRITRLALSKAARRLVILFIVLGSVLQVASVTVSAVNASRTTATARDLRDAHDQLGRASRQFNADAQACAVSGGIDCIHSANRRLGDAFTRFGRQLEDLSFPLVAIDAADQLRADTADIVAVNERLIGIRSGPEYQSVAQELASLLQRWDAHYDVLDDRL